MATSSFFVKYRPVRIGFVVRSGEVSDIVQVSRLNTILWGGIYNPIIPISDDLQFSRQLIKLFNVDVLFPVSNSEEIIAFLKEYEYLKSPHFFNRELFYEDWHSKKNVSSYLDISHIIEYYWDKEFKTTPKKHKSNCAFIEWNEKDSLANVFCVSFGSYPEGLNLKYDYQTAFLKGLRASKVSLKSNVPVDSNLHKRVYPLSLTRDRLQGYGGGLREDGIFLGNPDSFDDLLSFWNLRASGIDLFFLTIHSKRLDSFIQSHLSVLDKIPNRHPNIEDFICMYSSDVDKAKSRVDGLTTVKKKLYSRIEKVIWNGLNIRPKNFYFKHNQVLGNINYKFESYSVSIALPEKPVQEDLRNVDSQQISVVVDPLTEFEYPECTLKLPFIPELNEFFSRQIVFDPWKLKVDREGIGLIKQITDSVVDLYPIPNSKLIEKLFDFAGIKTKASQAGRLTYQIIQQMREHEPIEACRVFKIRGVRSLIKNSSSKKTTKWKEALKVIGSSNFNNFKRLFIAPRSQSELTPQDVWKHLLAKKIFAPYLPKSNPSAKKKKLFQCRRCGLKSSLSCKAFSGVWVCSFCKYEHYLPEFIDDAFKSTEIDSWRFRKSGLFSKDNNQEGAIPVILTLLQIKKRFHNSNLLYTTSLHLTPLQGKECETDFVVLNYRREDDIEIGIGECKSDFGKIDQNDVDNLKNIKKLLDARGLNCHLIFSKTADSFSKDEIALFKRLRDERIYPVLFTNKELEPYDPYEEYRTESLPRQYAFTLGDMAMNSAHIYLRDEMPEARGI